MVSFSRSRTRVDNDALSGAAMRLTERDKELCYLLDEHRVLTTEQINNVFFTSLTTTRHRLAVLYELRVLDRFRPLRSGANLPYHYVLDSIGRYAAAVANGTDPDVINWKADPNLRLATNTHLDHIVGVNGFFTDLLAEARQSDVEGLVEWWSERRCRVEWGEVVRPDGFGIWKEAAHEVQFFLEYDRGTEPLDRVVAKLDAYARLMRAMHTRLPVLFVFPGPRREADFCRRARQSQVCFATTNTTEGSVRSAMSWLVNGRPRRAKLIDVH